MPNGTTEQSRANFMTYHHNSTNEHYLKDTDSGEIFGRGRNKYQYSYKNGNHHLTINDRSQPSVVQNATIDLFETEDTLSGNGRSTVQIRDPGTGRTMTQNITFTYHLKRAKGR